jgi:ankyrin repeat protein
MSKQPLPPNPDLDKLKDRAKRLRDLVRGGNAGAIEMVGEHHPRIEQLAAGDEAAVRFKLSSAQLVLARNHGFASWPKLKRHVELVKHLARSPHLQPIGQPLQTTAERADELLRLACLTYGSGDRSRPDRARQLLDEHPELTGASIHTTAGTGDTEGTAALLAADPTAANTSGGPFDWPPLLYATYSRLPGADTLPSAEVLIGAGADPNAGFLWDGLAPPFTALTGALGGGERGEPPHPRSLELTDLLLQAGADPNDSQAIYNRGLGDVACDDTDFLELLIDHGLGRGDGGPWYRLLAPAVPTPQELLGELFQHAVEAGLVARTRLLLRHGADPNGRGLHPAFENRTAYQGAVFYGNTEIGTILKGAGADVTAIDRGSRFIGACLAGDRDAARQELTSDPDLLPKVHRQRPDLVARAAELGRPEAIRLLSELGFDVNTRRRTTALHEAAHRGDNEVVQVLLDLGADPTIEDTEHHSTPQGWAEFAGQLQTAALLADATRGVSRGR